MLFAPVLLSVVVAEVCFAAPLPDQLARNASSSSLSPALNITTCFARVNLLDQKINGVRCPSECPVQSACANVVQCINVRHCHMQDSRSKVTLDKKGRPICTKCNIQGCSVCGSSTSCKICKKKYALSKGLCVWDDWTNWYVLLSIVGGLTLWICIDFVIAHRRKVVNIEALEAGKTCRRATLVRDAESKQRSLFDLWRTSLHTDPILGPDVTLFMNWFALLAGFSVWMCSLSLIFGPTEADVSGNTAGCLMLNYQGFMVADISSDSTWNCWWTGLGYFGSAFMSACFFVHQRRLYIQMMQDDRCSARLQQYAIEATGFPPDAVHHDELHSFFDRALAVVGVHGARVEELSVAYNFYDYSCEIQSFIDNRSREERVKRGDQEPDSSSRARPDGIDFSFIDIDNSEEQPASAGTFWTQIFAAILFGTDVELLGFKWKGWNRASQPVSSDHEEKLVGQLEGSGTVFVVLNTPAITRDTLRLASQGRLLVLFRDKHVINVREMTEEPLGISWKNFGCRRLVRLKRFLICAVTLMMVVILWTLLYWPWSSFTTSSLGTTRIIAAYTESTLGLLIALGNAVVAQTVLWLLKYYGFTHQGNMMSKYVLIMIPCVLLNIVFDLLITSRNALVEAGATFTDDIKFEAIYGAKLVMERIFDLLVPGYILIPYVGEPFCTLLVPYFVAIWRIKGDTRITRDEAERMLVAPAIDIVNPPYCDMICTTAIFAAAFCLPSSAHWKLYIAHVIFTVILYVLSRVRILRWQSASYFGSDVLHHKASYFWALPLGLLAASFGGHAASQNRAWIGVACFVCHVVLHFAFIRYAVPLVSSQNVDCQANLDYSDVLRLQDIRVRATYRNSNPVEVLKAHHAIASEHSASPSPICFRGDTEYMQPHKEDSGGNGTAHCHSNLGTLLGVPEKLSCDLHTTGAQQHIAPTEKSTGEASANSERNEKGKLSAPARRVMSL